MLSIVPVVVAAVTLTTANSVFAEGEPKQKSTSVNAKRTLIKNPARTSIQQVNEKGYQQLIW